MNPDGRVWIMRQGKPFEVLTEDFAIAGRWSHDEHCGGIRAWWLPTTVRSSAGMFPI